MATMILAAVTFDRLSLAHIALARATALPGLRHSASPSILRGGRRHNLRQWCFDYGGFLSARRRRTFAHSIRAERREEAGKVDEAVDVSVMRFTLGIPGFDESDLPGILGVIFGSLLILNHVFSIGSPTSAQMRSEGVGLVLAAVSISLRFLGRQLNGTRAVQSQLSSGPKQIFFLADGLSDIQRQDLAWLSYNLLRNTATTAMLVWHSNKVVVARGFWGVTTDVTGTQPQKNFEQRLSSKLDEFLKLKDQMYLSSSADWQRWDIVPAGVASTLIQPFSRDSHGENGASAEGFMILMSNTAGGYNRKDRVWTTFLAQKVSDLFRR